MDEPVIQPEEKELLPLERQPWWQRVGLKPRDLVSYGLILAAGVVVLYNLGTNVWQNYQMKQQISTAANTLHQTQLEKERLQSLLAYYNTSSYQEIEIRRRLLLKKPDETVVALKGGQPLPEAVPDATPKTPPKPAWQTWWEYYFGSGQGGGPSQSIQVK